MTGKHGIFLQNAVGLHKPVWSRKRQIDNGAAGIANLGKTKIGHCIGTFLKGKLVKKYT